MVRVSYDRLGQHVFHDLAELVNACTNVESGAFGAA